MSLSGAVNSAVKAARQGLGDLVTNATLRKINSETYDVAQGKYIPVTEDRTVEMVPDKFSYNEMQDTDYLVTDIKILVFNPDNDIAISPLHHVVLHGTTYSIRKADPVYVGAFIPMWTVILKK